MEAFPRRNQELLSTAAHRGAQTTRNVIRTNFRLLPGRAPPTEKRSVPYFLLARHAFYHFQMGQRHHGKMLVNSVLRPPARVIL